MLQVLGGEVMNYYEFKAAYVSKLISFLNEPSGSGWRIGTPRSRKLASELADLEEAHPLWAEKVEDWLAREMPDLA